MGSPMNIVDALIGSLVCGASGYLAGYMKGASKWLDEIEDREVTTILNNVAAHTSDNVVDFQERAMAISARRHSGAQRHL
jgi:hypothetical protein